MKISKNTFLWTASSVACLGILACAFAPFFTLPEIESAPKTAPRFVSNQPIPPAENPAPIPAISDSAKKNAPSTVLLHPDARILANKSLPLAERARAAFRLAQAAPDGARDELLRIVENPDEIPSLRAAAAQALAQLDDRESRAIAEKLARGDDSNLARAAVRGLTQHDRTDTAQFLAGILNDPSSPEAVRMEAALGLAKMKSPGAYESLLEGAFADLDTLASEPIFHDVLRGLVRNYNRSNGFINDFLNHPEIDPGTKVVAIDEMTGLPGNEALAALLLQAQSNDPSIREAAAWAIAAHKEAYLVRDHLLALMENEPSSWVRSGLYEALRYQESLDLTKVWDRVAAEKDFSARMNGIKLIADHLSSDNAARFSAEFVPQLQKIATEDPSLTNRLDAIIALGRAREIEAASRALREIQKSNDTETRRAAQLALR